MASAGSDKVIRLWEPGSAVQTGCLRGMMDSVTDLAFVSDQDHIIAAGSDKSLRLWEIGSARERHTLTGHSDKVCSSASSQLRLFCCSLLTSTSFVEKIEWRRKVDCQGSGGCQTGSC